MLINKFKLLYILLIYDTIRLITWRCFMKAEPEHLIDLMFDNKRQYQIPVY